MFFFFKQKTAYEMRISDWSSDVCSSDLDHAIVGAGTSGALGTGNVTINSGTLAATRNFAAEIGRASCRERVCSTRRSRWSPFHSTKKRIETKVLPAD